MVEWWNARISFSLRVVGGATPREISAVKQSLNGRPEGPPAEAPRCKGAAEGAACSARPRKREAERRAAEHRRQGVVYVSWA